MPNSVEMEPFADDKSRDASERRAPSVVPYLAEIAQRAHARRSSSSLGALHETAQREPECDPREDVGESAGEKRHMRLSHTKRRSRPARALAQTPLADPAPVANFALSALRASTVLPSSVSEIPVPQNGLVRGHVAVGKHHVVIAT